MPPLSTLDQRLGQLAARRWLSPLLAALLLGLALWVMTRAWDASLLDRYQFRQTQTALTAYWLQQDGFQLAYPLPIFGPPWSVPFEFPLYQWLVALLANATGVSLLSAARLVGIAFFLLTLPAVYGLAAGAERDPRRRLLVPAAVLVAPVCLFYSRTFMIESCAAALAVWFLFAHVRNLQRADWRWTTLTAAFGILAALVKITTFALFGAAAVAYSFYRLWQAARRPACPGAEPGFRRLVTACLLPAVPILVLGVWWIRFTDVVKRANPYAEQFTSANLSTWNFGKLSQRWDPAFWRTIGWDLHQGILSGWMLLLLAAGLVVIAPRFRRAALVCAAGFLIGPLLFSNLYEVHDYYFFPSAFFAAGAAGIILAGVLESPRLGVTVKALVLLVFFGLQAVNFNLYYAVTLKDRSATAPPLTEVIRLATLQDGIVLVHGWDWNTLIPYYAERRAILVPGRSEEDVHLLLTILAQLPPGRIASLVMQGPHKNDAAFIHWRTRLLNLSPTPVAKSPDGDLYLPAAAIAPLAAKLAGHPAYPGVTLDFSHPPEEPDPRLHYQEVNPATYAAVASPAPIAVFNPWTVDVSPLAGQPTIFANAPSELHFEPPPGATQIVATVGLNERSYTEANPTDGVDVVIFELLDSGERRPLYQRSLDPARYPGDRGPQSVVINLLRPVTGTVVFALYPGQSDNIAKDWGYWRHIRIH